MSQKDQLIAAIRLLKSIGPAASSAPKVWLALEDIIAKAQNKKEHGGMGDGSIDEQLWKKAKKFSKAYEELLYALQEL